MDLRQKLLAAFQVEHREHLARMRAVLPPAGTGGVLTREGLEELLRRAHTLKGAARAADLRLIERLAHRLESLLSPLGQGDRRLHGAPLALAVRTLDAVEDEAAAAMEGGTAPATRAVLEELEGFLGIAAPPPAPATEPPSALAAGAAETVRVRADGLDRLLRGAGVLLAENHHQERLQGEVRELDREIATARRCYARIRRAEITPELAALGDHLRDLERRVRTLGRLQARGVRALQALSGQLEDDLLHTRTVSAESVFEGFGKMVRDLARDEGKEVELALSGLGVQADRVVLEQLKDGLMHALRNAITHGIEPAETREARGKPRAGRIEVTVQVQGGRLHVRVDDDGRGVDLEGVRREAVRRGLLGEGDDPGTQELLALLLRPGFSTARRLTDLAGRGVGLAVLHDAATRLQGDVEIAPREGGGASVVMVVPLSVLCTRVVLVTAGDQTFAIPAQAVAKLHRVRLDQVVSVGARPTLTLGGHRLPLAGLAQILGRVGAAPRVRGGWLAVLELRTAGRRAALAVDELLDVRDVVIRELGPRVPANLRRLVAGAVTMHDGAVSLVLSAPALADSLVSTPGAPSFSAEEEAPPAEVPAILVVDDSLTTRILEKSILEAHGYRVQVAVDGVDALQQLRRATDVRLVIADIQMPRMDGLELLERMKQDERLARLPAILLTSMEDPRDQARGLALGADAYLVKRRFDQHDLLETIRQLL
jgi:two-component system chemotaxis sensor kinase CheA